MMRYRSVSISSETMYRSERSQALLLRGEKRKREGRQAIASGE